MVKTKEVKQKRHAKRTSERALKNRRRKNKLITFWNKNGGQLKSEESKPSPEKIISNFINDKVKEPEFIDTIDVSNNNSIETADSISEDNSSNN